MPRNKLSTGGPEVGLGESDQPRFPRSPFLDNFLFADDTSSSDSAVTSAIKARHGSS
jgi:hypothetical protein